jgi:uncharacterized Tic20 family protein
MSEERAVEKTPGLKPETTSEERLWATLAHLSSLLTLLISLCTLGVGGLVLVFAPLVVYLVYKDKSRFVAYQAAQAFAIQVLGTVGVFVAFLVGLVIMIVVWAITGLLSAILIGLILIPVALLITIAIVLVWLVLPVALAGFSIVAAIQTANGADYRAPYVGAWVADWLERYEARPSPAV